MRVYNYSELINIAETNGCKFFINEPLSNHTTFKIGGNADLFINVPNEEILKKMIKYIDENKIPRFILGNGSNILASDKGYQGVILHLCDEFNKISLIDDADIRCGAGVSLSKLCTFARDNSLSGLEFAWGIPGTVGGAVFMNAGAYGGEMKDVVISTAHVKDNGIEEKLNSDELGFAYRSSAYSNKNYIITSVSIRLRKDKKELIKDRMDDYIERRKSKQPLEYPNAGSVFKRPVNNFAGTLIEQAGLKGVSVGGAQVSLKHAGFIINKGKATGKDVIDLINVVKEKVFEKSNVNLECELKFLGEFSK